MITVNLESVLSKLNLVGKVKTLGKAAVGGKRFKSSVCGTSLRSAYSLFRIFFYKGPNP